MAEVPVANPSNPSVRFAPLDTAVTMKMTMGIKINQLQSLALSPRKPKSEL